jgi:hypothetical protein
MTLAKSFPVRDIATKQRHTLEVHEIQVKSLQAIERRIDNGDVVSLQLDGTFKCFASDRVYELATK